MAEKKMKNIETYEIGPGGALYTVVSDLHTHTRFSHGKGTVEDIVRAAISKGLKQIGISEHGPGNVGFGVPRKKFAEIKAEIIRLRREYKDIEIMLGIEANIMGPEGRLDIKPVEYDYFDFVCAGWHFSAADGLTPAGIVRTFGNLARNKAEKATERQLRHNTDMYVHAVEAGGIKFLTHPGDRAPIDMKRVAEACAKAGTLLEINTSHMSLSMKIMNLIMPTDVGFIINSDAHSPARVGDFREGCELVAASGLDPKRVVNLRKYKKAT